MVGDLEQIVSFNPHDVDNCGIVGVFFKKLERGFKIRGLIDKAHVK